MSLIGTHEKEGPVLLMEEHKAEAPHKYSWNVPLHQSVTLLLKKFPFNPQEGALSFSAMSLNDSVTADNENDQDEDTEKQCCGRSLYQIGQALLRQWLSPFELCELADPKPELASTHVRFTVFQRAL